MNVNIDEENNLAALRAQNDRIPFCKGWSKESVKIVEENFILGENAFEKASLEIYEQFYGGSK